jgi:hypothetical protein
MNDRVHAPALARFSRRLWVLFWLLALLQAMDLVTTYLALASGAHEGNPALRAILFTPLAPLIKAFPLILLAILIVRGTTRGRPAPAHLLTATRVLASVYLVIVANNVALIARFH